MVKIERALVAVVTINENITFLENHIAVDLLTSVGDNDKKCVGVYIIDEDGDVSIYESKVTTVCTGGIGKVYLYSSNSNIVTGHGVA